MDSTVWHIGSMVLSGLATCVGVLIMHIVGRIERDLTTVQKDISGIGQRVARMEGSQERMERREVRMEASQERMERREELGQ
jgi:cob(I)alamin adenosyltransferase